MTIAIECLIAAFITGAVSAAAGYYYGLRDRN